MKKYIYLLVAVLAGAAISFSMVNKGNANVLNVNEIGSDPAAYSGTITVTGVMGGISRTDSSIFGVMDLKELQCTSANCNKVFIPVKYQGAQPVLGDEIKMTGTFINSNGGYLFAADNVKVLRNHKIGG